MAMHNLTQADRESVPMHSLQKYNVPATPRGQFLANIAPNLLPIARKLAVNESFMQEYIKQMRKRIISPSTITRVCDYALLSRSHVTNDSYQCDFWTFCDY